MLCLICCVGFCDLKLYPRSILQQPVINCSITDFPVLASLPTVSLILNEGDISMDSAMLMCAVEPINDVEVEYYLEWFVGDQLYANDTFGSGTTNSTIPLKDLADQIDLGVSIR